MIKQKLLATVCVLAIFGCQQTDTDTMHSAASPVKQENPLSTNPQADDFVPAPNEGFCTMEFAPVCATIVDNGIEVQRTFSNQCVLDKQYPNAVSQSGECAQ